MEIIRAATLSVTDLAKSRDMYCKWLSYNEVESGNVPASLAGSWDAPKTAGRPYSVLQPQSGAKCYIRMVEQPKVETYVPLTSYGWAAIEICNQDTVAVNAIMEKSPFEIIGPPKLLDGMPEIFPMQVKGPDGEIIYLTEIRENLKDFDLPRAASLIDKLFILVMACSDMEKTGKWLQTQIGLNKGQSMEIIYSMINKAFDLPADSKHKLATLSHERDICLEIDDLPDSATARPRHEGYLPPCIAIGSFIHPEFAKLETINAADWIRPPAFHDSIVYDGKAAGTLKAPDGTLIEVIGL